MRVLLISANREDRNMVTLPLGLAQVGAAAFRAGHEVDLVDLMGADLVRDRVFDAIDRTRPEAIGVSVRNIDDQSMAAPVFLLDQAAEVVRYCRERSGSPIVLGGAGYSIFPGPALEYTQADWGVAGEGDVVFPELLARLETGRDPAGLPGVHRRSGPPASPRQYLARLDDLPWMDALSWLTSMPSQPDRWLPIQTRRGCPLGCAYCSTPAIEGRRIRSCSPQRAAEWIEAALAAGWNRLFFTDNTFNLPPSWAKAFCRELIQRSLKPTWRVILHPGRVDEELAQGLAEAGCVEVSLGFESGSDRILARLGKHFTAQHVRRARAALKQAGIRTMGFLMLGVPGETRETVQESLDFVEAVRPDAVRLTVGVRIYPQTPLANWARDRGVVGPDDDLLRPRFYLEPGLKEWLWETAHAYAAGRPWCIGP